MRTQDSGPQDSGLQEWRLKEPGPQELPHGTNYLIPNLLCFIYLNLTYQNSRRGNISDRRELPLVFTHDYAERKCKYNAKTQHAAEKAKQLQSGCNLSKYQKYIIVFIKTKSFKILI